MAEKRDKVVVAMSGGVDSSVAACLLVEQGYEVIGLFMRHGVEATGEDAGKSRKIEKLKSRNEDEATPARRDFQQATDQGGTGRSHQGCCSASDAGDARFVAGMLGIPFYALNFEEEFDAIISYFADEYARGRTPNPCVVCNDKLKFGKVIEYADAVGAKYIATGHYARVEPREGRNVLLRAVDAKKDQSYVLFGMQRAVLDRVMFPIGHLEKSAVRAIATKYNLPNRDKPDSVDICFVPDRDYARVVRERRPEAFVPGEVVDPSGNVIGHHEGVGHYTIGQRRGLGIAIGKPAYVTALNVLNQTVTLGSADDLLQSSLVAERVNWLVDVGGTDFRDEACEKGFSHQQHRQTGSPITNRRPIRAGVKIRYLHEAAGATVHPEEGGSARVEFDNPQRAITPGQAVVFYDGETVLGGGWIA